MLPWIAVKEKSDCSMLWLTNQNTESRVIYHLL